MTDDSTFKLLFLAAPLFVVYLFASWYRRDPLLDAIPTVGFSDPILSYFSALRFQLNGVPMLKHGYEKTRSRLGLFKIPSFQGWTVLASDPKLIEDVKKAPDDHLSFNIPVWESLQVEYTIPFVELENEYHVDIIRTKLTRNIAVIFEKVRDELARSLDASILMHGDDSDWVKVPIMKTMQHVVSATSNRVFVGAPLCRDQNYLDLNVNFTIDVIKNSTILKMFPKLLRPIVARVICGVPSQIRQVEEFIRPIVEERTAKMEEFGENWDDKPNDMLMWLMSEAKGAERSLEGFAVRMLAVNFAAIFTTSFAITGVLYHLLSNPEYIEPLRRDVETAVAEEGWTKAGMDKMLKIDSFLRESQRIYALGIVGMSRLALRPFTFSNGVTVPAGTLISAPVNAIHADGEIYPNPEEFDGFRFAKLREQDGVPVVGQQSMSTSADYLTFGYGRHACPGRFFAANEVKALLAHILVTYDIKLEEGKKAPGFYIMGLTRVPEKANVMFRKRQK
ncbi:cytochrome P450 [Lactarius quietus]|nr:cytochrome P450 [Lactarius quietus]